MNSSAPYIPSRWAKLDSFERNLIDPIINLIADLESDGTVSISRDNAFALMARHFERLGGPRGTNAQFFARQSFNNAIDALADEYRAFFLV